MEDPEPSNLIILFLFISFVLSGFFSASEVALLTLSDAKVRLLSAQKKVGSKSLKWLKDHPDNLIITILIGNNFVNIIASVLATVYVTKKFGSQFLGVATGALTLLILVFGEIIPKIFAQHHSKAFALFCSPILRNLERVLFPLVWLLEKLVKLLKKESKKHFTEEELEGELIALAEIGEEGGALGKGERDIIENILEFSDTTVEEVMTPRPKIDAINEKSTLDEAVKFAIEQSHSRIPVFKKTIDNITGIITIRDLLKYHKEYDGQTKLSELDLRKAFTLPYTRKISEALKDFQKHKVQIGIVYDEHGGVEGLVTLEDLVEEVFGEIEDESDISQMLIKKVAQNSWRILGSATVEEIEEKINIKLDDDTSKTISLLVLERLERFPLQGEKVDFCEAEVYVEKMQENKIEAVRLIKNKKAVEAR